MLRWRIRRFAFFAYSTSRILPKFLAKSIAQFLKIVVLGVLQPEQRHNKLVATFAISEDRLVAVPFEMALDLFVTSEPMPVW